jgi:hypothetical protein
MALAPCLRGRPLMDGDWRGGFLVHRLADGAAEQ